MGRSGRVDLEWNRTVGQRAFRGIVGERARERASIGLIDKTMLFVSKTNTTGQRERSWSTMW